MWAPCLLILAVSVVGVALRDARLDSVCGASREELMGKILAQPRQYVSCLLAFMSESDGYLPEGFVSRILNVTTGSGLVSELLSRCGDSGHTECADLFNRVILYSVMGVRLESRFVEVSLEPEAKRTVISFGHTEPLAVYEELLEYDATPIGITNGPDADYSSIPGCESTATCDKLHECLGGEEDRTNESVSAIKLCATRFLRGGANLEHLATEIGMPQCWVKSRHLKVHYLIWLLDAWGIFSPSFDVRDCTRRDNYIGSTNYSRNSAYQPLYELFYNRVYPGGAPSVRASASVSVDYRSARAQAPGLPPPHSKRELFKGVLLSSILPSEPMPGAYRVSFLHGVSRQLDLLKSIRDKCPQEALPVISSNSFMPYDVPSTGLGCNKESVTLDLLRRDPNMDCFLLHEFTHGCLVQVQVPGRMSVRTRAQLMADGFVPEKVGNPFVSIYTPINICTGFPCGYEHPLKTLSDHVRPALSSEIPDYSIDVVVPERFKEDGDKEYTLSGPTGALHCSVLMYVKTVGVMFVDRCIIVAKYKGTHVELSIRSNGPFKFRWALVNVDRDKDLSGSGSTLNGVVETKTLKLVDGSPCDLRVFCNEDKFETAYKYDISQYCHIAWPWPKLATSACIHLSTIWVLWIMSFIFAYNAWKPLFISLLFSIPLVFVQTVCSVFFGVLWVRCGGCGSLVRRSKQVKHTCTPVCLGCNQELSLFMDGDAQQSLVDSRSSRYYNKLLKSSRYSLLHYKNCAHKAKAVKAVSTFWRLSIVRSYMFVPSISGAFSISTILTMVIILILIVPSQELSKGFVRSLSTRLNGSRDEHELTSLSFKVVGARDTAPATNSVLFPTIIIILLLINVTLTVVLNYSKLGLSLAGARASCAKSKQERRRRKALSWFLANRKGSIYRPTTQNTEVPAEEDYFDSDTDEDLYTKPVELAVTASNNQTSGQHVAKSVSSPTLMMIACVSCIGLSCSQITTAPLSYRDAARLNAFPISLVNHGFSLRTIRLSPKSERNTVSVEAKGVSCFSEGCVGSITASLSVKLEPRTVSGFVLKLESDSQQDGFEIDLDLVIKQTYDESSLKFYYLACDSKIVSITRDECHSDHQVCLSKLDGNYLYTYGRDKTSTRSCNAGWCFSVGSGSTCGKCKNDVIAKICGGVYTVTDPVKYAEICMGFLGKFYCKNITALETVSSTQFGVVLSTQDTRERLTRIFRSPSGVILTGEINGVGDHSSKFGTPQWHDIHSQPSSVDAVRYMEVCHFHKHRKMVPNRCAKNTYSLLAHLEKLTGPEVIKEVYLEKGRNLGLATVVLRFDDVTMERKVDNRCQVSSVSFVSCQGRRSTGGYVPLVFTISSPGFCHVPVECNITSGEGVVKRDTVLSGTEESTVSLGLSTTSPCVKGVCQFLNAKADFICSLKEPISPSEKQRTENPTPFNGEVDECGSFCSLGGIFNIFSSLSRTWNIVVGVFIIAVIIAFVLLFGFLFFWLLKKCGSDPVSGVRRNMREKEGSRLELEDEEPQCEGAHCNVMMEPVGGSLKNCRAKARASRGRSK